MAVFCDRSLAWSVARQSRIPWVMRQIGYETPRRAEITDRLRKSTKRWGVVRSGPSDVIVIDASNVESSYLALRRIPTTRVSARLSFGGGFRRLTLRRVAHLIVIVGVSAGIDGDLNPPTHHPCQDVSGTKKGCQWVRSQQSKRMRFGISGEQETHPG